MKNYEVWIASSAFSLSVRVEQVQAWSDAEAYRQAETLCAGDEFVRGVVEVEE
jgi:hypothetical protein